MRKIIICLLMIGILISTCGCGKLMDLIPAYTQQSPSDAALEQSAGITDVKAEGTSTQEASSADTITEKETTPANDLYKAEVDSIINVMNDNITDTAANALYKSYSRGAVVDCDGTENKQCIILFTEDGRNLSVELMRADSNGYLLTVRDDLGLLAGSLTASVKTGMYGSVPALFVITTNYDGSTKFGTVSVYSLENHDIQFVHEEEYEGNDQYKALEEGLLAPCGDDLCKFGENGVGQKIDGINFK